MLGCFYQCNYNSFIVVNVTYLKNFTIQLFAVSAGECWTRSAHTPRVAPVVKAHRGHNALRDEVAMCLREVDATTETEVVGLIPSDPLLRPADVLTKALKPAGEVALDVMVKSPYAQDAGTDPTVVGVKEKLNKYKNVRKELDQIGIEYRPFVYSTFGAPNPLTLQSLEAAAAKASSCPRAGTPGQTLARWKLRISVTIWKRVARMTHKCLAPLADPERDIEKCRDQTREQAEVEDGLYEDQLDFGEQAW